MCGGQERVGRSGLVPPLFALLLWIGGCASVAVESASDSPSPAPSDQAAPAEQVTLQNTLRWKTASEVDNFGFDVYRGPSEEGLFTRLNSDTIQGAGTTDEPQHYSYVDDTIEAGVEYWYYVESLSMTGAREQFTPIFKAKVKYPADG